MRDNLTDVPTPCKLADMNKITARTTEELTEALNDAERGTRILAVTMEPANNDLDGMGLDILALGSGQFHVFHYDASMDSEAAIHDEETLLTDIWPQAQEVARYTQQNLDDAREE